MTELFAGVDLGTTSIRAAVFDAAGRQVRSQRWSVRTDRDDDGSAIQAPAQWVDGVADWLTSVNGLAAWSVGGQMNTYCLADANGSPLSDAITWQDRRRAVSDTSDDPVTAFSSRALLLAEQYPSAWERAQTALLPKDVLIAAVTGEVRGDRLSWNGVLDRGSQTVAGAISERVARLIPPLSDPTDVIVGSGPTAATGLPDTIAVIVGCGLRAGTTYNLTGTSETLAQVGEAQDPSHGFRASVPVDGRWIHVGPSSVGGATLEWAASILTGGDVVALIELAAQIAPREDLPLFRPYLLGERAPLWDNSLTAAWDCVRGDHGRGELAFAVVEGVGFSLRYGIEQLALSAGAPAVDEILCTTNSAVALQLRANALGRPLRGTGDAFVGARGAATVAYAGYHGVDLITGSERLSSEQDWITAQPASDYPDSRYSRWLELSVRALRDRSDESHSDRR